MHARVPHFQMHTGSVPPHFLLSSVSSPISYAFPLYTTTYSCSLSSQTLLATMCTNERKFPQTEIDGLAQD